MLLLGLVSFDANDPSLNHVISGGNGIANKAGLFGAYTAGFLNDAFGIGAFVWPLALAALGAAYVTPAFALQWWRWCGFFLLTLFLIVIGTAWDFSLGDIRGGGLVGRTLNANATRYLSPAGSALLWFFVLLVGLQLACNFSWFTLMARFLAWIRTRGGLFQRLFPQASGETGAEPQRSNLAADISKVREMWRLLLSRFENLPGRRESPSGEFPQLYSDATGSFDESVTPRPASPDADDLFAETEQMIGGHAAAAAPDAAAACPAGRNSSSAAEEPAAAMETSAPSRKKAPVPLPDLNLLVPPERSSTEGHGDREAKGKALMASLQTFGIQGELVRITTGPVVTMFEVRPAPGIRVNRIASLSDDLALALKAVAVRIQAPVPGTDIVGIEIPNEHREMVNFRELAASNAFRNSSGPLTMILGKDISGKPFMADLTRMPHMLVAGATGAGKSVCLNSILISFLYRIQPEQMKLLLIDPKRVEMAIYADLPHLVHPVVTEMSDAKNALDWATHEMDSRYDAFSRLGVRNIEGFNQKLASFKDFPPPDFADLEPLPYIAIVIDELADLMLTAAREVETSIVRLAQLARGAGIHMILATQRPSVDVVTGIIKANFPCRIAFQVASMHDSRTILDQPGAERLLGRGDMLFKPSNGPVRRLHGPFLSDEEVQAVVNHWKHHLRPSYQVDFARWGGDAAGNDSGSSGDGAGDALYDEVVKFVRDQGRASISLVQRRFKIGFNRAARLVEQLETDGIIGPADGSKPRAVVK